MINRKSIFQMIGLFSLGVGLLNHAAAQEVPIKITYVERPPFIYRSNNGDLLGLVGAPAALALSKSGMKYTYTEVSPTRAFVDLKENKVPVCTIGWYKTSEREEYSQFTKPIYQDSGFIALTNPSFKLPPHANVESALSDSSTQVLVKEAFVYGPYLRNKLANMRANKITTNVDISDMIKLVQHGRVDIAFFAREELMHHIKSAQISPDTFKIIEFKDMPVGEKRYILCSRSVPDYMIGWLNRFIPN